MQNSRKLVALSIAGIALLVIVCIAQPGECQSAFGSTRPSTLFEPSLSFIRQNIRLVTSYVALFRSIFVGAYERPLVTSTDVPLIHKVPAVKIPASDLPNPNTRSTVTKHTE